MQNEDLELSYGDVWDNSTTGKAKIILNLLSVVFMAPFVLIEGNTMCDYGFNWFSMWNLLDIVTYSIQVITCIVYISRKGIEDEWFSVLMAVQVIFLFAKVQYFSRYFSVDGKICYRAMQSVCFGKELLGGYFEGCDF